MSETGQVHFPCRALPDDPAVARLLGVYPQRQQGQFMQRVKILGGRISSTQWRALAALAQEYTPLHPLRLTTRQDIELHGLAENDIPGLQHGIHAAGLTTVGACGDTLRNITVCPGNGFCPGTTEVSPLAESIRMSTESLPWIRGLPRKFKISISACEKACAKPWINDIGLMAGSDGQFRAVVGGSLGAKPGAGMLLDEVVPSSKVIPLVVAALRFFHAKGDRVTRSRARLRHIRERKGDFLFQKRLVELVEAEARNCTWPQPMLQRVEPKTEKNLCLRFPHGEIEPVVALDLAGFAEKANAQLCIGLEHNLWISGDTAIPLKRTLTRWTTSSPIVSCPGLTYCSRAIVDSRSVGESLQKELPDCRLGICVSGCPNNCAHAAVAEIGLVGRLRTVGQVKQECFQLLVGGGKGETPVMAQEIHASIPATKVSKVVRWIMDEYLTWSQRERGPFSLFVTDNINQLAQTLAERVRV